MDKVSRIIPPSTRQVWVSGEIEKPKRVAEPVVPGFDDKPVKPGMSFPTQTEPAEIEVPMQGFAVNKGIKLDTRA